MLLTRRMDAQGLMPMGFVSNDYALAVYGLKPVTDPQSLFSADILDHEFIQWVAPSSLLKRAFRDVAVISGLIAGPPPGTRQPGRTEQERGGKEGRGSVKYAGEQDK